MAALTYAGTSLGTVISMLMAGVLTVHFGNKIFSDDFINLINELIIIICIYIYCIHAFLEETVRIIILFL